MKNNMSFKDRSFRILLAIVAVITFESDIVQPPADIFLLVAAVLLVITAAIGYCPLYSLLGIRRWEQRRHKFDRLHANRENHHYYHVNVSWSGDRHGVVCSPEVNNPQGRGSIEVATPPQFPKGIPGVWSPEHLFTAAVSSCMMTTFLAVAEKEKLKFNSFACPTEGKLERTNGSWMMTEVTLHPTVTVNEAGSMQLGKRVLDESLAACLISNSIRARIISKPIVSVVK
jgi:organic hydroperoxide reductase OsmC/OhrA